MGGVLHTVNPRLFDDQLEYIANHAEDRVLLYDHAFAPLVERMKPQWTTIEHYICFDPLRRSDDFDEWLAPRTAITLGRRRRARPVRPVLHQRHHRQSQGRALRASLDHAPHHGRGAPDIFDLSARAVVLPIVPMFHANAWGMPLGGADDRVQAGAVGRQSPERMCDLFREEGVTHSAGVPTVWLG
jgi:acyl-CoA synthetase (AMP-forming)/AMP-acid ligase II